MKLTPMQNKAKELLDELNMIPGPEGLGFWIIKAKACLTFNMIEQLGRKNYPVNPVKGR